MKIKVYIFKMVKFFKVSYSLSDSDNHIENHIVSNVSNCESRNDKTINLQFPTNKRLYMFVYTFSND